MVLDHNNESSDLPVTNHHDEQSQREHRIEDYLKQYKEKKRREFEKIIEKIDTISDNMLKEIEELKANKKSDP